VGLTLLVLFGGGAHAQVRSFANLNRVNSRLGGKIDDYTHNHHADGRIYSPILGKKRDLYVYRPPGYDPRRAYPLMLYLHMAEIDENTFTGSRRIDELDALIQQGEFPPIVIAVPDGTLSGRDSIRAKHSLFINGEGGRFEDHVMSEVLPFVMSRYSIRPAREAHAIFALSAGAFGGMNLALKHRDFFGVLATLAGPLNLRYSNCDGHYFEDFDPATYRWKTVYKSKEVVGKFYLGFNRVPARKYITPVFGKPPGVEAHIARENPADLIFTTNLQPGELAMYVNYPKRDNWNFDAQDESFAWLASLKGIPLTLACDPGGRHTLHYFRRNHLHAWCWLRRHLLPPTP
jgi:S-formylglutathione hydrolase FrmB